MAKNILVGQTVRINERYAEIINGKIGQDARKMQNQVGTEFVVTSVASATPPEGHLASFYVKGDPNSWGIWGDYLEVVPSKMHTTTTISTILSWHDQERIVSVTSGSAALSLSVLENPHKVGDMRGSTSLTPEQAEELAHDLLVRVAEIRGGQN